MNDSNPINRSVPRTRECARQASTVPSAYQGSFAFKKGLPQHVALIRHRGMVCLEAFFGRFPLLIQMRNVKWEGIPARASRILSAQCCTYDAATFSLQQAILQIGSQGGTCTLILQVHFFGVFHDARAQKKSLKESTTKKSWKKKTKANLYTQLHQPNQAIKSEAERTKRTHMQLRSTGGGCSTESRQLESEVHHSGKEGWRGTTTPLLPSWRDG